jgi:hypothetical protein
MDPLALGSAFATIVSLIGAFKKERRVVADDEYKAFLEWLEGKRHDEIIQYIEMNTQLVAGIRAFLQEDNKAIIQKLETIDTLAASIASRIEGLAEIAKAVKPNQALSNQALSILKQLNDSGQSRFIEFPIHGRRLFQMMDGPGQISFNEPQFIEDDLRILADLGLLRLEYNSSGRRIFYFTRAAADLVRLAAHGQ